jgi:hypothetical protein
MGAYAYCKTCERGLKKPTFQQVLDPFNHPYVCGSCLTINEHSEELVDVIQDLVWRIEELEKRNDDDKTQNTSADAE